MKKKSETAGTKKDDRAARMEKACRSYLDATCARRDAKRLLDIGFFAATAEAGKVLVLEPETLEEAVHLVAAKEALDIMDIYATNPDTEPSGRTAESALKDAYKRVRSRYRKGKCDLCGGPAFPCAKRHVRGRGCA